MNVAYVWENAADKEEASRDVASGPRPACRIARADSCRGVEP
jgi:hypothetical protein